MNVDTVILELPVQIYTELQTLADAEERDVIEVLKRLIAEANAQEAVRPQTRAFASIMDRATDLGVEDLAAQHDHYLYGVEKK